MSPKITIIITHYNEPIAWLKRAIDSALVQTCDKEVIVIDDCSKEDPYEQIKDYPITYIRHAKNQRISAVRNTAIAAAKGEWIVTLDSDDYFYDKFVLYKMLLRADEADVLYGNLITQNDIRLTPNQNIMSNDWKANNQIYATSLYKKKVWESVGGFWVRDEAFPEDYDFWGRAFMKGFVFEYVPVDLYYHTYRPDSEWEMMRPKFERHKQEIIEHIWSSLS